tara:strand:- start:6631 stop:6969 length:339 start_codon:yes stop_codon:yes gene_type:complete
MMSHPGMIKTRQGLRLPLTGQVLAAIITAMLLSSCASDATTASTSAQTRQVSRLPTPAEVEQYNASVAPEQRIVCRSETPVGSNIPVRTCRLAIDIDETSTFHREQLRRALR